MKTLLCEIMTKYGSDKGNGAHNYTILYHELFGHLKNEKLNIFELGLGTNNINLPSNMGINGKPGASLRGWKDFFSNSFIYGADIDRDILFNEDRITTFYCNQKDHESVKNMWNNEILKDIMFDIIIDDGLHEFDANLIFMKNSLNKVNINGYYICEDLLPITILLFEKEIPFLKTIFKNFEFKIIQLYNPNNKFNDNNLLVVKRLN